MAEPGDARSPHLALFQAEDNTIAERPAPAPSGAIAESEDPAAAPANVPESTWALLDAVDLQAEFALRLPTLHGVPAILRPGIRQAFAFSLRGFA